MIIFFKSKIIETAKRSKDYIQWQLTSWGEDMYARLYEDKKIITALSIENSLLRAELNLKSGYVWKNSKIIPEKITNILWKNNERFFLTSNCNNCVAINEQGIIGYITSGNIIRPITHRSSMLIARSLKTGKDYLLQGQGYHKKLKILESDLTDYPPIVNDILVTAGIDSIYPGNLIVGKVISNMDQFFVIPFFNKPLKSQIYLIKQNV